MRVSITLLQYDHGLIRQVADVLGESVKQRKVEKHPEEMSEIVGFLERFTDRFHHRKEELYVFPAAVSSGTLDKKDYDELLVDHEEARRLIASLRAAVISKDVDIFYADGKKIADHMQTHIRREEDHVFPRIEEGLTPEMDLRINKQFEEFMASNFPANLYEATESFANWVQDNVLGPGYFEYVR